MSEERHCKMCEDLDEPELSMHRKQHTLTAGDVAAIEERASKATPGPWFGPRFTDDFPPGWVGVYQCEEDGEVIPFAKVCVVGPIEEVTTSDDCAFIAAARSDVPRLCQSLRAAWERADKSEAERDRVNQMLRDTGYGQGQIDCYVAQCEEIERLIAERDGLRAAYDQRFAEFEILGKDNPDGPQANIRRRISG